MGGYSSGRHGGKRDLTFFVSRLAKPMIDREKYPSMHTNDAYEAHIRALVATELATKIKTLETIENPASMRASDDIVAK